jgi:hypothetical protein
MSATQVGSSNCDLQADGAKAPQVEFVRRFVIDQFERKVERLFSRRVTSRHYTQLAPGFRSRAPIMHGKQGEID